MALVDPGPKCPEKESVAASDSNLCKDDGIGGLLHPGERCYRTVVPRGSSDESGLHCCYDEKTGDLSGGHTDRCSPAVGGGGGTCDYDFVESYDSWGTKHYVPGPRIYCHFAKDVFGFYD
jgi:hypothetical protein